MCFIFPCQAEDKMKKAASNAGFIWYICLSYFCLHNILLRNAGKFLQSDSVCMEKKEQELSLQQLFGPFSVVFRSQLQWLAGADCAHFFLSLHSVMSCWQLEIDRDVGIYIMEICECYQSGI